MVIINTIILVTWLFSSIIIFLQDANYILAINIIVLISYIFYLKIDKRFILLAIGGGMIIFICNEYINTYNKVYIKGNFTIKVNNPYSTLLVYHKGLTRIFIKPKYYGHNKDFNGLIKLTDKKNGIYHGRIIKIFSFNQSIIDKIRINLIIFFQKRFPKSHGIIIGFLIGYKNLLNNKHKKIIYSLGLGHLFAVSGLHITIFFKIIFNVIALILYFCSGQLKFLISYGFSLFGTMVIMFLSRSSPSAVRSFMMNFLSVIGKVSHIKISSIHRWTFSFVTMIIYNTYYLRNISFLMSFFAVLGLISHKNRIIQLFNLQYFINVISLGFFRRFNMIGMIYNLLFATPLIILIIFTIITSPWLYNITDNILHYTMIFLEKIVFFKNIYHKTYLPLTYLFITIGIIFPNLKWMILLLFLGSNSL